MLKGILSEDAIWLENVETVNMPICFKQKQFRDKDTVDYCVLIDKLLGLMGDVHLQQKYLLHRISLSSPGRKQIRALPVKKKRSSWRNRLVTHTPALFMTSWRSWCHRCKPPETKMVACRVFMTFERRVFTNKTINRLINVLLRVYMYIYSIPLYRPTVPHCFGISFKHSSMTTCNRTFSAKWLTLGERLFSKAAKILFLLNKYRAAKSPWRIREGLIRNRKELRNWKLNTQTP